MSDQEHHHQAGTIFRDLTSRIVLMSNSEPLLEILILMWRETFCLKKFGEEYRCDASKVGSQLGLRDYGALLINRIGRRGYKINFQVVMLLWDFK